MIVESLLDPSIVIDRIVIISSIIFLGITFFVIRTH